MDEKKDDDDDARKCSRGEGDNFSRLLTREGQVRSLKSNSVLMY